MSNKPLYALVAALILPVFAAKVQAQQFSVQEVPLTTNHVLYDAFNQKIYASIPAGAHAWPNSVAQIDAASGKVEKYIPVAGGPDALALSCDGQYLFVGTDVTSSVARVNVAAGVVDQKFYLGATSFGTEYTYHAGQIVPLPGLPESVAVTRNYFGLDPANDGVVVFDNGVMRPSLLLRGWNIYDSLTASASPDRLYSYDNESTAYTFAQINADAAGLSLGKSSDSFGTGILEGFGLNIKCDKANGLVYATNGRVINPEALTDVGQYPLPATDYSVSTVDVVPNAPLNRVYFLNGPTGYAAAPATLWVFNQARFQMLGQYVTPTTYSDVGDLYEINLQSFVFRSDTGVEILHPQLISGVSIVPNTVMAGQPATITVALPAPAPVGGASVVVSTSGHAVRLAPDDPSVTSVTVVVPAGRTTVKLPIMTGQVTADTTVPIRAVYQGQTVSTSVLVKALAVAALGVNPVSVTGGLGTSGSVTLNGLAPQGGLLVRLSASDANVIVPATVTIPQGAAAVKFPIKTRVVSASDAVTITAFLNAQSASSVLTVRPVGVAQLAVSPGTVGSGGTATALVTLDAAAPAGGVIVSLTSALPGLVSPQVSTVLVPAGSWTASFTVLTGHVLQTTTVQLTASAHQVSRSASLTITP